MNTYICGECLQEKQVSEMEVVGVCDCCKECWKKDLERSPPMVWNPTLMHRKCI